MKFEIEFVTKNDPVSIVCELNKLKTVQYSSYKRLGMDSCLILVIAHDDIDYNQLVWDVQVISGERKLLPTDTVLVRRMWKTIQPFDSTTNSGVAIYLTENRYYTQAWQELQEGFEFSHIWQENDNWYVYKRKDSK